MALNLTKAQRTALPDLHATESTSDPVAVVRFFFGGRGAFYATERSTEDLGRNAGVMFGWMVSPLGPDYDEWGYTTLAQLGENYLRTGLNIAVERDLYFSPKPISQATKQNGDPAPHLHNTEY